MATKAQGSAATSNLSPPTSGSVKGGEGARASSPPDAATMYGAFPALASRVRVTLKADAHPSKWWMVDGRGGEQVDALLLVYTPVEGKGAKRVYVYDGDHSGTLKFIREGGSGAYGHMEIEPQNA